MDLVHLFSTTKQLFENRAKKSDLSIIAHSHSKRTKENAIDISLANEETHPMNLFSSPWLWILPLLQMVFFCVGRFCKKRSIVFDVASFLCLLGYGLGAYLLGHSFGEIALVFLALFLAGMAVFLVKTKILDKKGGEA